MTVENKGDSIKKADAELKVSCCKTISIFACVCGVLSLLLHINSYIYRIETDFVKINEFLDVELDKRISAYVSSLSDIRPVRLKRDAMVVSIKFMNLILIIIKSNIPTSMNYITKS